MAGTSHPGFKRVEESISRKEGVPQAEAGAILASRTRDDSAHAKHVNPNLRKVK